MMSWGSVGGGKRGSVRVWLVVAQENNGGSIVCRFRNYFQVGGVRWLGLFTQKVTLIR